MTKSVMALIISLFVTTGLFYFGCTLLDDSASAVRSIEDEVWEYTIEHQNLFRLKLGLPITKLQRVTLEQAQKDADFAKSILAKIEAIPTDDLSHEEWLSLELLRWQANTTVEGLPYYWLSFSVTPYASPLGGVREIFRTYRFESEKDLGAYFTLLGQIPRFVADLGAKLYGQAEKGIRLPVEEIDLVIPFLRSFRTEPGSSPFFVEIERLGKIEPSRAKMFQENLRTIIGDQVNPALDGLIGMMNFYYREQAPEAVGLHQYPQGKEYYSYLVRAHTTMDITPEKVHEKGLELVEDLKAKMKAIRNELGFEGTQAEFHEKIRTLPRFLAKTPDEVGERLMSYVAKMEEKVPDNFSRIPKAPYGVKRLDPALEGSMTFGYYQWPTATDPKGYYLYNGSKLDERPLAFGQALIYHELVPGHHFQLALQFENAALSEFRRQSFHGAYTEGWGDYAAWLGLDLGLYDNPYDLYGRYLMDIMISARLVVDTGMNYYGWPRSKAVELLKENIIQSDTEIHTETLRYSVDIPGQALGYKMGSIALLDLRRKAEEALGERFDVRRFHAALLESGSMPVTLLEKHMDWYIEQEKGR